MIIADTLALIFLVFSLGLSLGITWRKEMSAWGYYWSAMLCFVASATFACGIYGTLAVLGVASIIAASIKNDFK